jgi:hypothetical protein
MEPFIIDDSDLTGRVEEEFFNLAKLLGDYVTTEIVARIFDSFGKLYLRVSVRFNSF